MTVDDRAIELIQRSVRERGFPPTVRELGCLLGLLSPASAHRILERLVEGGRVVRVPGKPRAIRVVDGGGRR